MIKPLDIVKTPRGSIAVVQEINLATENIPYNQYSIEGIGLDFKDKNAWWNEADLKFIDSIPSILARCMCHPFSSHGKEDALSIFPNK